MFIGDQAQAAVNVSAATTRLAGLAADGSLIRVSHVAWGEGTARIASAAGLPELVVVRTRGPARRGAVSLLILRWEAADASGQRFPVLDADITLVPHGEQATLVGLDGVYRTPPGAGLDPVIVQRAAAATIRSFLGRLAGAITDPRTLGSPVKVSLPPKFFNDDQMIVPPAAGEETVEIVRGPNIVPLPQLDYDLQTNNVPNFVWISPDQCNDMHGVSNGTPLGYPACSYPSSGLDHGAIKLGDQFLRATVNKIMSSRVWWEDSIIVIAWDEDDYNSYPSGCCFSPTGTQGSFGDILGGAVTPAIVIRGREPAHRRSDHPYNHYSLLATIQHLWNLPCLANTCSITEADLMLDLF